MNREVKGVLVFAGLLLLVLAGFYISYVSLKDNLPEGETFTTFVGNAMKQFSRDSAKVETKLTPTKKEFETKAKRSEVGQLLQSIAIEGCFKTGCYDTDGNDPTKKGKVYIQKAYQKTLTAKDPIPTKTPEGYSVKTIGGKMYQCIPTDDYCKDTAVIEQTCGFGQGGVPSVKTSFSVCPCGCANGVCTPCQPVKFPDLVVKSIAKTALSEQCANSFTSTICNEGDADITTEFTVTVNANSKNRDYLVKQNKFEKLVPNGCVDIVVPALFSIGSFGLDLNQNAEVTVTIDSTKVIDEKDETNNEKKETVFTGDAYYYDENFKCDTYCYETDVGKEYAAAGTMTFKYSGAIDVKEDLCPEWDLNQVQVYEQYCKLPIILKSNGKFSNPANNDLYNCLDSNPPKKCSTGQCVPLSVTCEDAYGNLGPCLQCLDFEGPSSDPTQYKNYEQYFTDKNIDPFVKGTIHYTSIDNVEENYKDTCLSTEWLTDYICTEYNKYPLIDDPKVNCYKLKTNAGEGHACINGHCVLLSNIEFKEGQMCQLKVDVDACQPIPSDIDSGLYNENSPEGKKQLCLNGVCKPIEKGFEQCVGPTKDTADPFKAETVTETKLLGGTESRTDFCDNYGDSVVEFYCDGNYYDSKATNCDTLLDENGKGASCVLGKCAFSDESLKSCTENGDSGVDTEKEGYIQYTTAYGLSDSKEDRCSDQDTLIETYCNGKEVVIYEHSCKDEGKVCSNNACKTANPALLQCQDTEGNSKDKTIYGKISGVDQFGDEYWTGDDCGEFDYKTMTPSNKIWERYCENKQLKEEELTCDKGMLCKNGKCSFADESLKSCNVDPTNNKIIQITDLFGEPHIEKPECVPNNEKKISTPICNGNFGAFKTESCPTNTECKWDWENGASCVAVDYSKVSCIETATGAIEINKFGDENPASNYCTKTKTLNKATCTSCPEGQVCEENSNGILYLDTPCPVGQACNWNINSCAVTDNSKISCKVIGKDMIAVVDEFGNEYISSPGCASKFSIVMPYCDGNKPADQLKTEFCNAGEECNWNTNQCQKVDYSKVSCTGPTQPNFFKKEKVLAYNQFGEQITEDGFFEDICIKDIDIDEQDNFIAEVICVGTDLEFNIFECPSGKICKAGVCI